MTTVIVGTVLGDGRIQVDENGQKSVISPLENGFVFTLHINGDYVLDVAEPLPGVSKERVSPGEPG